MTDETSLAERRAILLQAAAEVGRAVSSILDLDDLLAKTVDIICDEFDFYYAGVFLLKEDEPGGESSGERLRKALERVGFVCTRQRGSHMIMRREDPPALFRQILKDAGLTIEQLTKLL